MTGDGFVEVCDCFLISICLLRACLPNLNGELHRSLPTTPFYSWSRFLLWASLRHMNYWYRSTSPPKGFGPLQGRGSGGTHIGPSWPSEPSFGSKVQGMLELLTEKIPKVRFEFLMSTVVLYLSYKTSLEAKEREELERNILNSVWHVGSLLTLLRRKLRCLRKEREELESSWKVCESNVQVRNLDYCHRILHFSSSGKRGNVLLHVSFCFVSDGTWKRRKQTIFEGAWR